VADTASTERIAFYSVLRYVPDPLRDEPINVGLFLVAEDNDWARFEVQVPRTRLTAISRRGDAERIEDWAAQTKARFDLDGLQGLFRDRERLSRELLASWAEDYAASLRLTEPRVAVDSDLDRLWGQLFGRLVRSTTQRGTGPSGSRAESSKREKKDLVKAFVDAARKWPTFDPARLRYSLKFDGNHASHLTDLAVLNGQLTGIAQALPLGHGTESEVITSRALLLDAAVDLDLSIVKLGLYRDPPQVRRDLLLETTAVFNEAGARRNVKLIPARNFDSLERRFALTLFPAED
jgi:Protein of unknown function (DUF3037)